MTTERAVTCQELDDLLADLLEETLEAASASRAEAHVSTCARCQALVRDLQQIRALAAALPDFSPPPRAWERIRTRLATPRVSDGGRSAVALGPWRMVAAAAVLLVAVSTGLWSLWTTREEAVRIDRTSAEAERAGAPDPLATVEAELALAAQHYEQAMTGLEEAARATGTALDPTVVATLRTNLALIDQAIDDSRHALRAEPDDPVAQASLLHAFQRKVTLLQDTLGLMRELRLDAEAPPRSLNEG